MWMWPARSISAKAFRTSVVKVPSGGRTIVPDSVQRSPTATGWSGATASMSSNS